MDKEEAKRILEKDAIRARDTNVPSSGEPLTLEQLREKIDEPVYLYIYDTVLNSGWHIIKAVTKDKIIFRGWDTVYVPISSIGKSFDLYAYPPTRIDREKWEPCEFCGEWIGGDCTPKEQDAGYKLYAGYYKQVAVDDFWECETDDVRYCPNCGRPLTPEALEELEKRLMTLPEPPKEG